MPSVKSIRSQDFKVHAWHLFPSQPLRLKQLPPSKREAVCREYTASLMQAKLAVLHDTGGSTAGWQR